MKKKPISRKEDPRCRKIVLARKPYRPDFSGSTGFFIFLTVDLGQTITLLEHVPEVSAF
jgi:hypothetical protein